MRETHPSPIPSDQKPVLQLMQYDGRRVAIALDASACVRGVGHFECDDILGNILRIRLEDVGPGKPEIIINGDSWRGTITPDFHFGCDWCFIPRWASV